MDTILQKILDGDAVGFSDIITKSLAEKSAEKLTDIKRDLFSDKDSTYSVNESLETTLSSIKSDKPKEIKIGKDSLEVDSESAKAVLKYLKKNPKTEINSQKEFLSILDKSMSDKE